MATVALTEPSRRIEPADGGELAEAATICVESARDEFFGRPARGILLGVVLSVGMWAGIFFLVTLAKQ
jgi:hypothetical protein